MAKFTPPLPGPDDIVVIAATRCNGRPGLGYAALPIGRGTFDKLSGANIAATLDKMLLAIVSGKPAPRIAAVEWEEGCLTLEDTADLDKIEPN